MGSRFKEDNTTGNNQAFKTYDLLDKYQFNQ